MDRVIAALYCMNIKMSRKYENDINRYNKNNGDENDNNMGAFMRGKRMEIKTYSQRIVNEFLA